MGTGVTASHDNPIIFRHGIQNHQPDIGEVGRNLSEHFSYASTSYLPAVVPAILGEASTELGFVGSVTMEPPCSAAHVAPAAAHRRVDHRGVKIGWRLYLKWPGSWGEIQRSIGVENCRPTENALPNALQ
jgi:hypothetical protein